MFSRRAGLKIFVDAWCLAVIFSHDFAKAFFGKG